MDNRPREGEHYIVDLYAIAEVAKDAEPREIRQSLNARLMEYAPDRLQGLAPKFQEEGARRTILLNRARKILLNETTRLEYDGILSSWEGAISSDGTPAILMSDDLIARADNMTNEQIEAHHAAITAKVTQTVHYNPRKQELFRTMFENADAADRQELATVYDDALFAEDQVLAIEEAGRSELLNVTLPGRNYEVAIGRANAVAERIDDAKTSGMTGLQRRALGGVGIRLALLAGEASKTDVAEADSTVATATYQLPHYFEDQAEKLAAIAAAREALLQRRLDIFQPSYPIAEQQTEGYPKFFAGITAADGGPVEQWIGFSFDAEKMSLDSVAIAEDVDALLTDEQYAAVYVSGFNIFTFPKKDQIDLRDLLNEACNKHLVKYFPDVMNDETEESEE
jgi:curved DNA-binding protein CbpA